MLGVAVAVFAIGGCTSTSTRLRRVLDPKPPVQVHLKSAEVRVWPGQPPERRALPPRFAGLAERVGAVFQTRWPNQQVQVHTEPAAATSAVQFDVRIVGTYDEYLYLYMTFAVREGPDGNVVGRAWTLGWSRSAMGVPYDQALEQAYAALDEQIELRLNAWIESVQADG